MDNKKVFEKFEDENVFIKTTVPPSVDSAQKAALNRQGNVLYNSGDIEAARRIFMATGYSDGLSRIGDYYRSKNRLVEALHMYWIAPDRTKAEPLIMQAAATLQGLLSEGIVKKDDECSNDDEQRDTHQADMWFEAAAEGSHE